MPRHSQRSPRSVLSLRPLPLHQCALEASDFLRAATASPVKLSRAAVGSYFYPVAVGALTQRAL